MKKIQWGLPLLSFISLFATSVTPPSITRAVPYTHATDADFNRQLLLRPLIIFLDESEKNGSGAVADEFFQALSNKLPIVASSYIVHNYLQRNARVQELLKSSEQMQSNPFLAVQQLVRATIDHRNIPIDARQAVVDKINKMLVDQGIIERFKNIGPRTAELYGQLELPALMAREIFDPRAWQIYSVDDSHSLYLLIPELFLRRLELTKIGPEPFPIAYKFGMPLSKMERLPSEHLDEYVASHWKKAPSKNYFIEALSRLFIPKAEYAKLFSGRNPCWIVYLMGHGHPQETVATIPVDQFHRILDFFDEKVLTKLLVYLSCYAAGVNEELIYKNVQDVGKQRIYSYPIMSAALNDYAVMSQMMVFVFANKDVLDDPLLKPEDIAWDSGELIAGQTRFFSKFFNTALASEILDFKALAQSLRLGIETGIGKQSLHGAQLRLPGLPWFSVINAQDSTVSIGNVLAATRTQSMNVMAFFQQQRSAKSKNGPLGLLLYTQNIPFKLDMSTLPELPEIISMVPGPAVHRLSWIDAGPKELMDVLKKFRTDEIVQKVYLIDYLEVAPTGIVVPKNVKLIMPAYNIIIDGKSIFYNSAERYYKMPADFSSPEKELEENSPEFNEYNRLFQLYRDIAAGTEEKIQSLKQVSQELAKIHKAQFEKEQKAGAELGKTSAKQPQQKA